KEFKIENDMLVHSKHRSGNIPRDVAIFLQRRYCGQTLSELGKDYNIATYSTVSSAFERIKLRLSKDHKLKRTVSKIEAQLEPRKGQRET
ncbi:MAG: transposase, partial [Desulfocapsa sp.]